MSLARFIYYSAIVGGWAAFAAWAVAEAILLHGGADFGTATVTATGAIVGAVVGVGLNLVAGMTNAQWQRQLRRIAPGVLGGGIGGALAPWSAKRWWWPGCPCARLDRHRRGHRRRRGSL